MITLKTEVITAGVDVPVELFYTSTDPACVIFTFFNPEDGSEPEWVFGRDLLKDALENGDSGLGDVIFNVIQDKVKMGISSPEGQGYVLFTKEILEEFVELIYEEVPEGEDVYEIPDGVPEDWELSEES